MSTTTVGEATLVGAAWRHRVVVLITLLACLVAAIVYAESRPPVYTAVATMVLQDPHADPVFASAHNQSADRYASDQIAVLKSAQLAAAAAAVGARRVPPLNLSASEFAAHTSVAATPSNGNSVQITFTAADEATALGGVDAVKTAYEQTVQDGVSAQLATLLAQIDSELSGLNSQIRALATAGNAGPQQAPLVARRDTLLVKRDQVVVDSASGANGVSLYLAPQSTTHSSKLVTSLPILATAAVVGLLLGALIAYLVAARRRLITGASEPEALLGAPFIAAIPRMRRAHTLPMAEASVEGVGARGFRSAALFIAARPAAAVRDAARRPARPRARRLLVTSSHRGDGRSTVAANLGLALADSGLSTLLVDADPQTGRLGQILRERFSVGYPSDRGVRPPQTPEFDLMSMAGTSGLAVEEITRPGGSLERLGLMTVGHTPLATEDPDRDARLQAIEAEFDVVVIDGPPLSGAAPYWPLLRRVDGALVVIPHEAAVDALEELSRLLAAVGTPAFGYLFNHRPRPGRRRAAPQRVKPAPLAPPSPPEKLSVSA